MSRTLRNLIIATTLGLSLAANPAVGERQGYYKWVDEKGRTQFSQTPPEGVDATFVETHGGHTLANPGKRASDKPAQPKNTDAGAEDQEAEKDKQQQAEAPTEMEVYPEKDPQKCEQARNNVQVLNSSAQIRVTGEDGMQRFISDEEREAEKAKAEKIIRIHCP